MRTYEAKAFTFDELSDEAKEKAKQRHAEACGYSWDAEAMDSLRKFAQAFDAKLTDWQVDWFAGSPSHADFDAPEMSHAEIARRLLNLGEYSSETLRGAGDCKLTGYCADEDALDGFRKAFFSGEKDLCELLQEGFQSWLTAAQADCEHQYGDEGFSELSGANDWEFDEEGDRL
jgi:hypothetical protein